MDRNFALAIAISALCCATQAVAQGNAEQGKAKAAACFGCHGPDGNSLGPDWPKLAGQLPAYMDKQINDFKAGRRTNPTMSAMAQTIAPQDVADISAYFASQKRQPGTAKPELLAAGKLLFEKGKHEPAVAACMGCHGPQGQGGSDWSKRLSQVPTVLAPAIGGQQPTYIAAQLRAYRTGERANDPGRVMRDVASRLSEAEILAVAEYAASRAN